MATFSEALAAAVQGKAIKHPPGLNRLLIRLWIPVGDRTHKDWRLVHHTDIGYLEWVPHQWEILDENWVIL